MFRKSLLAIGSLFLVASTALPDVVYTVSVDTSTLEHTHGGIDFNFGQGPIAPVDAASVSLSDFITDGAVGSPSTIGDVSGTLPGAVILKNTSGLNDYFTDFWFGNSIWFTLDFSGPAVNSPTGFAASGSSFAFSLFSDPAGTVPALTTDSVNGYAFTVAVNPNGTTSASNYSNQTALTLTPEPGGLLSGIPLLTIVGLIYLRKKQLTH